MKKQLISSITCFALLVIMFVGSSIAWFTDTESSVNTMEAGKIAIEQSEDFDESTVLLPSMTVNKEVTVENTGNQPCYVRTLFAFEDSADGKVLDMINHNCADDVAITIPGVTDTDNKVQFQVVTGTGEEQTATVFTVGYFVYPAALPANDHFVSLQSITLDGEAGNDWTEAIGDRYEIIVLSQASQVTGLGDDPVEALNTAFNPITGTNCVTWFQYVLSHTDGYENASVAEYAVSVNP